MISRSIPVRMRNGLPRGMRKRKKIINRMKFLILIRKLPPSGRRIRTAACYCQIESVWKTSEHTATARSSPEPVTLTAFVKSNAKLVGWYARVLKWTDNQQPATTGQGECWHACRPLMNMTIGHDMLLLLDDAITGNSHGLATLGWDAFRTSPVWILASTPQSAWWSACRP
jgi:hypothetical protein